MNDCVACVCKYDYLTLCEPVSDCTKKVFIYVGVQYSDVLVTIQNVQTKQAIHSFAQVDALGYAFVEIKYKFLNTFEGGKYRLNITDLYNNKYVCLEYECKLTQNIMFNVAKLLTNGSYKINEPCVPQIVKCTTQINLNDIFCTTTIPICQTI